MILYPLLEVSLLQRLKAYLGQIDHHPKCFKNKPHSQKSSKKSTKLITDPKKLPKGDTRDHIWYDTDSKGRQVEINILISYPKAVWQSQRKLMATKAQEHKGDTTGTTPMAQAVRTDTDDLLQAQTVNHNTPTTSHNA